MDKSELISINRLRIRVNNDRCIELSPEEARRLRNEINDLLGPKAPWPVADVPNTPILVDPNREPFPEKWSFIVGPLHQSRTLVINL